MSDDRWGTALVLGGIRSGKSAFAEALVADAPSVRYIATAVGGEGDPEWLARIEAPLRILGSAELREVAEAMGRRLVDAVTGAGS